MQVRRYLWAAFGALLAGVAVQAADKMSDLDRDPHLVARWKLDETTGKTAADSSGRGHAATLEGGLSFDTHSVAGPRGKALRLDGTDDCLRAAGFKGVVGSGPRTISVWIKVGAPEGEVISWGKNDHGKMWALCFIRCGLGVTPKGGYLYMKRDIEDNAWHHIAAVVREASPPNLHDDVKLYKDGEPAEIDDIGLLDLWPIETVAKEDVCIGRRFKGRLSDLRIYDRAISEDEVKTLYRQGK
jgi:hypothetical protein